MSKILLFSLLALPVGPSFANAALLDLSSWSQLTLDFPGAQPSGNWVLESGNTAVRQVVNADPSFFLNNTLQTSFTIEGTWQVLTSSDDDFMGFVFGYQNSSNFYLFDWKQGSQPFYGSSGKEGMSIRKMTGATGNGLTDLSLGEFWENAVDKGDSTVLATNQGAGKGWQDFTLYNFKLDFNNTLGQFRVEVKQGATVLWDQTVFDSTFTNGQFGFYNFSQSTVRYAGFEQTGGVIVPEPSTFAVWSLFSLVGLAAALRRRRKVGLAA